MAKPLVFVSGPPNVRLPAPLVQVASEALVCISNPGLDTATLISTKNDLPSVPFSTGRKTPDGLRTRQKPRYEPTVEGAVRFTETSTSCPGPTVPIVVGDVPFITSPLSNTSV